MSKYKVGDKVLIQGEVVEIDNSQMVNTRIAFKDNTDEWFSEKLLFDASKTYSDGLTDAWELARKVALYDCDIEGGYSVAELKAIFNRTTLQDVFRSYTIQEALAKIEAYEESKAIKVGDVVECFSDYKGVVLNRISEQIDVFTENGDVECLVTNDVKKTNKHLDIEHLLEQIRG